MRVAIILLMFVCFSCSQQGLDISNHYLRHIGDISFDATQDKHSFYLCDSSDIRQYHNFHNGLQYNGEKNAIIREFGEKYANPGLTENGFIRIRFVVNCKGETGRFRLLSSDQNFKPNSFSPKITNQLIEISKSLDDWKILPDTNNASDYYQYLSFKISDGQIIEILP